MGSWASISVDALKAAKLLNNAGHWRACVNRSYYAAYSAVTARIPKGTQFSRGRQNPAHDQIPRIARQLLPPTESRELVKDLKLLRHLREDADYRPGISVDSEYAVIAIHAAGRIARVTGVI